MEERMLVKSMLVALCFGLVASSNVINTIATSEIFEDAIPEGFSTSKGVSDSETLADFDNGDEFVDTEKDANVQETATKDDSTETNGGLGKGSLCGKESNSGIKTKPNQKRRRSWWSRRRAAPRKRRGYIRYRWVRRRKDSRRWWITRNW